MPLLLSVVVDLHVRASYRGPHTHFPKLIRQLSQCSDRLERLSLSITISHSEEDEEDNEAEQAAEQSEGEQKEWASLKALEISECSDNTNTKAFWSWLWKQCGHVKSLTVKRTEVLQSLAEGMLAHMPQVCEVTLGHWHYGAFEGSELNDVGIAMLLSGSIKGWKQVLVDNAAVIGRGPWMSWRGTTPRSKNYSWMDALIPHLLV